MTNKLAVAVWLVIFIITFHVSVQAQSPRPNVIVILADDLGYGDLSSYGAADVRTPNIDALVADGMRFSRFYANSPVCSPTRAALLTGKYPDLVGVPGVIRTHANDNWGRLSSQAVLLPQLLKPAGYHSALVGKWHLGLESPNTPNNRGFNFFHGFLGDMMDDYYTHRRFDINYMRRNEEIIEPQGHATELFTDWAINYLNERKASRQPFFLYLAYNAPHTPIQPPAEWLAKVRQRAPGMSEKRAKLVALIEHFDDGVGRVIKSLKANNQYDNTLIIFTSDNGGQLDVGGTTGGLRGGKQNMYEGGIRVPACAVWKNRIKPGSHSDQVLLTMDLFPTICAAANVKVTDEINGISMLPMLLGENQNTSERTLFWVRREGGAPYFGQDYYAVRRGPWKLVHNTPFEPLQLFNLNDDPVEARDLAKEKPNIMRELTRALGAHIQQAGAVPWR